MNRKARNPLKSFTLTSSFLYTLYLLSTLIATLNTKHNDCKHTINISHSFTPNTFLYRNSYTHFLSNPRGPRGLDLVGTFKNRSLTSVGSILLLLLVCGDTGALVNPGPRAPKNPCQLCGHAVKWGQRAIQCDQCCDVCTSRLVPCKLRGWLHGCLQWTGREQPLLDLLGLWCPKL